MVEVRQDHTRWITLNSYRKQDRRLRAETQKLEMSLVLAKGRVSLQQRVSSLPGCWTRVTDHRNGYPLRRSAPSVPVETPSTRSWGMILQDAESDYVYDYSDLEQVM
jgi:hypothetical protein